MVEKSRKGTKKKTQTSKSSTSRLNTYTFTISDKAVWSACREATKIRKNAYAPYSNYSVGCVLIMDDGSHVNGVNVENSSYGATMCAERTAIFNWKTNCPKKNVKALVFSTVSAPGVPCGMCLQVMSEFIDRETPVYHYNGATLTKHLLSDIIPFSPNVELRKDFYEEIYDKIHRTQR